MLMQENRSFDHYFGTLSGVRGFDDPKAPKLPSGKSVFYQPDPKNPDGYLLPFRLNTWDTSAQAIPSTSHSWGPQHDSCNNGKMDGFVTAHREVNDATAPFTMSYYTRDDVPFQHALADAFTICDDYHCSVLGPTWPNRTMWMTAWLDPEGKQGGPMTSNTNPPGGFTWTTYAERLEAAGVSWQVYQEEDNYGCNAFEEFATFKNAKPGEPFYEKGVKAMPQGQFEYDALHDNLPTVSWIIPTSTQSEHPDYMPAAGAAYVASKIDAIAANPEVWAKTVFILSYDENDGLFDHVPPPLPPAGTAGEFIDGLPIGGGMRVPCIVVSPWTTGGYVCSKTFDHTSQLQFLESVTGVKETNISDWRRKTFGNLGVSLRFGGAEATAPIIADTSGSLTFANYATTQLPAPALPGADQPVPHQEKGSRPHWPASKR